MVFEAVFLLVLLKIPLVYACLVVWWAIRAEPREEQPAAVARVTDTPTRPGSWSRTRRPDVDGRRGPRRGAPTRSRRTQTGAAH